MNKPCLSFLLFQVMLLKMYKITFDSLAKGMIKPEKTSVKIVQNKTFTSYSITNKAKTVYEQMIKDGKTGICLSRGCLIQVFPSKYREEEVLEIVKKDIENGCIVAEKTNGTKIEISNLEIIKK